MKRIKGLLCFTLFMQSFLGMGTIVSATEGTTNSLSTSEVMETSTTLLEETIDATEISNTAATTGATEITEVISSEFLEKETNATDAEGSVEIESTMTEDTVNAEINRVLSTTETSIEEEASNEKEEDLYATVIHSNYRLFTDSTLQQEATSHPHLLNQTVHLIRSIFVDGKRYYSIEDNKEWLGYLSEDNLIIAQGKQGMYRDYGKYVTVNGNYNLWDNFTWENKILGSRYKNQTFEARFTYQHFNGNRYYSLYNNQGRWLGYIDEKGVTVAKGEQGIYQDYGKYVTVKGNYNLWDSFTWQNKTSGANYKNQTLEARYVYQHFNGVRYYSLYNNQGRWLGYIDEKGVTVAQGEQGVYQDYGKYVTVKGNYNLWDSFTWQNKTSGASYKNQTLEARGSYQHFNGIRYYSLYNNQGRWLGYIDEKGVTVAQGEQGVYQAYGKYVTVKGAYNLWDSFTWQNKTSGASYKNQTLEARGSYQHFNGIRYYSLYNNQGYWLGYMDEKGATLAQGPQGVYHEYNQLIRVTADNPIVWKNFNFKEKIGGNHKNKNYLAKGYYQHINGTRYLSLYNNGKWVGYLNENSTRKARGAAAYLQTTRKKLIDSLNRNKNIYLGTPYKSLASAPYHPERLMSPIGRPNGNPPAFNCTGFVARAVRDGGGNLNRITSVTKGWGTSNNAYNWRDALVPRTDSISFNTINDLLKSGLAKKGDIIYLEADFSKPGYDCHIGIFWGDTPTDNKFWHSTGVRGNAISHIFSGTPYSKAILIPMD